MARKKQIKRLLAFLLIFVMVVPIVSFATSDSDEDTTETETTETEATTDDTASDTDASATDALVWDEVKAEIQSTVTVDSKQDEIKGHEFVCENSKYELYVNKDNLSILIRCKENGAIIESTADENELAYQNQLTSNIGDAWAEFFDSGIVIQVAYELDSKTRFASAALSSAKTGAKNATLTYKDTTNGFICHLNFEQYNIEFDVQVTLTDEGVEYYIPISSLVEAQETTSDGTTYYLAYLYAFPLMGKTQIDAREGYMIVPDGNGMIIELKDNNRKYTSPWVSRIYGRQDSDLGLDNFTSTNSTYTFKGRTYNTANDPNDVILPIYGMVYTDTEVGILCSIDDGDSSAQLYANMNGAQNHFWNYIAVQYIYRDTINEKSDAGSSGTDTTVLEDEVQLEDVKATFIITTGEDADYAGLAVAYREHLLANGTLVAADEAGTDTSFNIRVQVLADDVEDFLVMKRDVTMTTIEQLEEIINDLSDLGANDLLVVYEGWQNGGVYDLPVTKLTVDSSIGTKNDLADLYDTLESQGNTLVLMEDAITINTDTSSSMNAMKKMDKTTYEETTYDNVYTSFKVLYPTVTQTNVTSLASSMRSSGLYAIGLSGISDNVFAYSRKSVEYSRLDTMTTYSETLAALEKAGMYIALEQPYSYLWKYTDAFMDMPLSTSGYIYETESIPFVSIVLKGVIPMYSEYINFEANSSEYFLQMAETGVYPSFYLTYESPSALENTNSDWVYSSEANAFYDQIAEYSEVFGTLADATDGAVITDHEIVGDVSIVTYSNGIKVYVNYGNAATVDDEIGAMKSECFSIYDSSTGEVLATYSPD